LIYTAHRSETSEDVDNTMQYVPRHRHGLRKANVSFYQYITKCGVFRPLLNM